MLPVRPEIYQPRPMKKVLPVLLWPYTTKEYRSASCELFRQIIDIHLQCLIVRRELVRLPLYRFHSRKKGFQIFLPCSYFSEHLLFFSWRLPLCPLLRHRESELNPMLRHPRKGQSTLSAVDRSRGGVRAGSVIR